MSGIHELADYVDKDQQSHANSGAGNEVKFATKKTQLDTSKLYDINSDRKVMAERPWKKAKYFSKTYISSLAIMKMSMHAASGGSIEIMGIMTGKIVENAIIVMDSYPLPVEGTETRVNAQAEGYEYMVQYLEELKKAGREEHIVGWYHSHPGYGCWLSGIDVATQSLNQKFQDPYMAVVVDPLKTQSQGLVEIGAFRTFPENYKKKAFSGGGNKKVPKEKLQDFGAHAEDYYPLEVEIFHSKHDNKVIELMNTKGWISNILPQKEVERREKNLRSKLEGMFAKYKEQLRDDEDPGVKGKYVRSIRLLDYTYLKKFDKEFELEMTERLQQKNEIYDPRENVSISEDDGGMSEEDSDYEGGNTLDVSDVEDVASMESSSIRNKRADSDSEEPEFVNSGTLSVSSIPASGFTYLDRQRKFQKRKVGEQGSTSPQVKGSSHSSRLGVKDEEFLRFGERELKLAKATKNLRNIQRSGDKVGSLCIEHLLTLRAQEKIFGRK